MRIDVQHSQHDIDDELDTLHARLHQPGHRLHGLPAVALGRSGLIVRHREADGEYFLYVEDPAARQSVGAAQLWTALAQHYPHGFVDIEGRALRYLGDTVPDDVHGALHTRRLLLGNGWAMTEFARAAGMSDAEPVRCDSATIFNASARTA